MYEILIAVANSYFPAAWTEKKLQSGVHTSQSNVQNCPETPEAL
jgi:hypothetical protein